MMRFWCLIASYDAILVPGSNTNGWKVYIEFEPVVCNEPSRRNQSLLDCKNSQSNFTGEWHAKEDDNEAIVIYRLPEENAMTSVALHICNEV